MLTDDRGDEGPEHFGCSLTEQLLQGSGQGLAMLPLMQCNYTILFSWPLTAQIWLQAEAQIPSAPHSTDPRPQSPAAGRRGRKRPGDPLTLQREEGQEEAQHPDAVQPVGPHVSAALDAPRALRLSPLRSRSLAKRAARSLDFPLGSPGSSKPDPAGSCRTTAGTQNGCAPLSRSASPGPVEARSCA
ncbi:hypothetical protein CB1_001373002 [Camelus ferus]|nr:hypothetical protein CB1_001373002 [Camelus ferus]